MEVDVETKKLGFFAMFSSFQSYLDADQDTREEIKAVVRNIEQTTREILSVLQAVHRSAQEECIAKTCQRASIMFKNLRKQYSELIAKIPAGEYYRSGPFIELLEGLGLPDPRSGPVGGVGYSTIRNFTGNLPSHVKFHDLWRFVNQRASFLASFLVYLQSDRLITREEVASMLEIKVNREEGFHINLDDFLTGLLLLANELSRFAVNCVTVGDYTRPEKIASFVSELDAGFRLLNLKNDALRKKFDGLKYDLKKIEEVVYDIKIRGLPKS